ncbi:MAG: ATP-binding cassette domain-containing protein [Rhizobiaceae bacterium]|nr:ATP-binding cassette domain-containing protein [Rhizobiaceae bacterium]
MSEGKPLIEIANLSLSFGGLTVLKDINLSINAGEVLCLLGPNGAGKTALVNCITGVYAPDPSARILVEGQPIHSVPGHERRKMGISRTFQHVHLVQELSGLENTLLGLAPEFSYGLMRYLALPFGARREAVAMKEKAEAMLQRCGAWDYRDTPASAMPLGIRRRVDLARALVSSPRILLLDEPASGLTHDERDLIAELLEIAQAQEKLAVIWIEHDLDLVLASADRAAILHHGQLVRLEAIEPTPESRNRIVQSYMTGQ